MSYGKVVPCLVLGLLLRAPTVASQDHRFSTISTGVTATCALDASGRAYCWGANDTGELGSRTTETCKREGTELPCSRIPIAVATDLRFASIVAGDWHSCALDREGRAFCWGNNDALQLGVDSAFEPCRQQNRCSFAPVAVRTPLRFIRLALGSFHTCGLTTDGRIACWGLELMGQLGNDSAISSCADRSQGRVVQMAPCRAEPLPVAHAVPWTEVGAWGASTCALDSAGEVFCWGVPIGSPGTEHVLTQPTRVEAPAGVHALSVSNERSLVLSAEGLPLEWGWMEGARRNWFQVTRSAAFPADLEQARREGPRFRTVAAGVRHRCGLTASGEAYCWGENGAGQLGTGGGDLIFRPGDRWRPGMVAGGHHFQSLSAGALHTCGLTVEGDVLCWGENVSGQLGIGTKDKRRKAPAPIAPPREQIATP